MTTCTSFSPHRIGAILTVLTFVLGVRAGHAQRIERIDAEGLALGDRWELAATRASGEANGYWIGYAIDRLMGERSFMGTFSTDNRNAPSLARLLYGRDTEPRPDGQWNGVPDNERRLKEVGLLVRYGQGGIEEVVMSNLSLAVDLRGRPLYWIGKADQPASAAHLIRLYAQLRDDEQRESALAAVAMHQVDEPALGFLIGVLEGNGPNAIREPAAFWLGQRTDVRALAALRRAIAGDRSADVREHAVFAVSQMDTPEAEALLVDIARNGSDPITREKAIFWLGQKASDNVTAVLTELLNDGDTEVQKQALFAISQMEGSGLPLLIDAATSHPSLTVRKQAIMLLGNSGDPRAVETLIDLARLGN